MIGAVDNPRNAAKGGALMKYIAICGTVGSGKTTMLGKLLDHFGARASFHEERPQDNPFILLQPVVHPHKGRIDLMFWNSTHWAV